MKAPGRAVRKSRQQIEDQPAATQSNAGCPHYRADKEPKPRKRGPSVLRLRLNRKSRVSASRADGLSAATALQATLFAENVADRTDAPLKIDRSASSSSRIGSTRQRPS